MVSVYFTKMHGLGNDFVVIEELSKRNERVSLSELTRPEVLKEICHRRFGIGADQVLMVRRPQSPSHHARIEIWNADGSQAEMCGNGLRAIGIFLKKLELRPKENAYFVETLAGIQRIELLSENRVRVELGAPFLPSSERQALESVEVLGRSFQFHEVAVGNPHAVIFLEEDSRGFAEKYGPLIETHHRFPNRTNVEFVEVIHRNRIKVSVWERGAGITLACGSGACASAAAAIAADLCQSPVEVSLPGGVLEVRWAGKDKPIYLEGEAQAVFDGHLLLTSLRKTEASS